MFIIQYTEVVYSCEDGGESLILMDMNLENWEIFVWMEWMELPAVTIGDIFLHACNIGEWMLVNLHLQYEWESIRVLGQHECQGLSWSWSVNQFGFAHAMS